MAKDTFSFEEAVAPAKVFSFEEALGESTVDRGPALETDPLTRVSPSTPGAQPTFTAGPTAGGQYERPGFAEGFTKGIIESQRPLGPGGVLLRAADALTGGFAQERFNKANQSVLDDKTAPALAGEFAKPAPAKPRATVLQPRTDTISPTGGVVDALADVPVNTARSIGSSVLNFGALAAELGLTIQSPEQFRAGAAKLDKAKARTGLGVSDEPLARTGTALDSLIPSAKTLADYAPEGIKQLGMMAVMGPGAIVADAGARGVNQAREDGLGLASSVLFGAGKAASEGVPEAFSAKFAVEAAKRIPLAQALRGDTQAVTTAFSQTAQSMGIELGSEQVSALGNWVVDKIAADPTATPDRLVADMKEAVKATIVQGPTMLAGAKLMQTAATGLAQRPEDRAARDIARAIDQTDLPGAPGPTLNPNLAAAKVMEAPSIDAAIRVAEQVVATPTASAAVDNIARLIGQPLNPDVAATTQAITELESADVSAPPEIPAAVAEPIGSRPPEPAPVLDAGVGVSGVAEPALDAGGVRAQPAPDAAPLGAPADVPAAVAPGIVAQARTPAAMPVNPAPQAAAPEPTAEQKIREVFSAAPRTVGNWHKITVEHNGKTQEFLANMKRVNTSGKADSAIHLVNIRPGRLLAGEPVQDLAYYYKLDGKNNLVEEGIPSIATPEQLKAFGRTTPDLPTNPQNVDTSAAPAQKTLEIEQVGPFGRDMKPVAQGGKPFKTKAEADAFRKANSNNMRTVKSGKGFALRELTAKELAAREKAAKRIAQPRAGQSGVPISAHAFIADRGGLARGVMADAGFDRNMKVGNRWLFAGADKPGLTLAEATELLAEAGYIREESEAAAADIIKRSMRSPQYTAEGWERIAEAERATRFEDHLAAQQDVATEEDPFGPEPAFTPAEIMVVPKSVREEYAALMDAAEAAGIDTESVLEEAARIGENWTQEQFNEHVRQTLEDAVAGRSSEPAEETGAGQGREDAQRGGTEGRGKNAGRARGEAGVAKPLYASRPVTNAADIIAWAQSQGFKQTLPAEDLHVTVAYSSQPVDGSMAGPTKSTVTVQGGKRSVEPLGDGGAIVLKFDSQEMQARWKQYRDAGASWDYEGYTPHITLTYNGEGLDLSKITPYKGPINLGVEKQEALNEDKADEYVEEPTLTAPTEAEVLAQQDRKDNAAALDDKAQIDREAEGQTLTAQTAPEQRRDNTGDMFGGPSVDDFQKSVERSRKPGTAPEGPDLFAGQPEPEAPEAQPDAKPASEMSAAELLRAAADKMEAAEKAAAPATKLEAEQALWDRINAGTATLDEFKAGFEAWVSDKAAIVAEMLTKKKDDLLRIGGPYFSQRYKSETKPEIAEALWRDSLGTYSLGKSVTYGMGKDSYQNAVRRQVEATDDAELAQHAEDIKAAKKEREQRAEEMAKAVEDPKTLADYEALIRAKAKEAGVKTLREALMLLTPEQRAEFDRLGAAKSREARKGQKEEQQSVRVAGQQVEGQIIETKHTQKGYDLFVVQLAERVSREDYETLNTSAKRMGGYYSSFRGRGAVPGFQFKDRATADAFVKLANGDSAEAQQAVDARRDAYADDRSQTAVERLTEMADKMQATAEESLGRERKANTERRARFAAAAEAAASADKAMAKTMRNIAEAIEGGNADMLARVRTKSQVEMLTGMVRTAKDAELRAKYPAYADQEKRKGEPATADTASYAEFPTFTAFRSDLASLARQLLEVDGTKKIGAQLMKVADDVSDAYLKFAKDNLGKVSQFMRGGDMAVFASRDDAERAIKRSNLTGRAIVLPVKRGENRIILSPSEAIERKVWTGDDDKRITLTKDFGQELVQTIGRRANKTNKLTTPWQFETASDRLKALARLGIETAPEFRTALREFIGLQERAQEADRVKMLERAMVGRKKDGLDFFPTPQTVADEMVETADIQPDMAVLEPSAGMGHIADRIRAAGAEPDVIEMSGERRELLEAKGFTVVGSDFMELQPRASYTYGDVFRAPDGTEGVMRGGNSLGRVRLVGDDGDMVGAGFYNREDLTGIRHNGTGSGYDRIVMNPPFSDRRDAEHVQHAYTLLKPGGRLVAIMGEGVFFGQDKKAEDFRSWLEKVGGTDEKLAEGTFMDPTLPVNTGVNARMVVIDKPEGEQAPSFSRGQSPATGLTLADAQRAVDALKAAGLRKLVLAETIEQLPESGMRKIKSENATGVRGMYDPVTDTAYLVRQNLTSMDDALFVGLHEAFHRGLRKTFGAEVEPVLNMIHNGNARVQRQTVAYMQKFKIGRMEAIEEVLADMAGQGETGDLKGWDKLLAFLRDALGKIAKAMGVKVTFTDEQITDLVAGIRRAGMQDDVHIETAAPQTETKAFKDWFGDSVVTESGEAGGVPLVVYRGSTSEFAEGAITSRGVFFADRPETASQYAGTEDGSNVVPAYLSIKNPYTGHVGRKGPEIGAVIAAAKRGGHDGAIVTYDDFPGETAYVAFKPDQIKSAIGNRGTFGSPPSAFDGGQDTFSAEQSSDSLMSDAEFLRNLSETRTFQKFGLGGFDIPSRSVVMRRVLGVLQNLKIRQAVIGLIPVEVVDILRAKQLTTEMLLNDMSMLKNLLAGNSDKAIPLSVDASRKIANAITEVTAKHLAKNLRGVASDSLSTSGARPGDAARPFAGDVASVIAKNATGTGQGRSKTLDGSATLKTGVKSHYAIAYDEKSKASTIEAFDPKDPDIRFSRTSTAQTDDNADPVRPELSPWRDATGRLQFAPGAWLWDKLGNASTPILNKLQLKAASPELRRIMRQMKLDVAKAQEVAAAVAGEATKLTDEERAMVSDLIEKEMKAGTVPPEHAVRLAALINASMESQTDELVRLGMLTKDSADKWRGQYLPRYYESKLTEKAGDAWADAVRKLGRKPSAMKGIRGKHLKGRGLYETIPESQLAQWESLGWEVRDPDYTPGLPTMDGTVQIWRDFTRQERDKMGEIRDAGFRFVMGYMETQKDIALGRMFEQLATDPEMSSRLETEKFSVRVPDGKAPGTETKTYGKLAGRWVSPETLSQLSLIEESQSEALIMYRKAMGAWKEMKTVLNPVSHVNNTVSNMSMAHFAGVSYGRADKYLAAMRDFAKKSPMILEAKDNGLFLGTLSEAELMNTLPEELKILAQKQEGAGQKIARSTFDLMSFYLRRPMGWAYQAEDTFFRYLIYKDARERGMEPQDAVDYAQRYIFTYDDLPKNARRIRDIGIPFFAYTYKAVPALLHTALTHPERLAAPAAVLWTINAAAYAIAAGDDEDDWDTRLRRYLTDPEYREKARQKEKLERELLPEWNKGTTSLMTPKVVRLGNDELTKLPLFIDISRIIPGGDLFDVNPNAGGIPLPQPITPSHPLFTTAVAMLANKDTFFGKELTDNNDTSGEKFEKRAAWLWKQFSPAIAVNNYHWQKGMNALAQAMGGEVKYVPDFLGGDSTGRGRDGLPVQPKLAALQTFGIKVRPYDFDEAEQIQESLKQQAIRGIDIEMRKLKRLENKGAVAERTVEKERDLANVKKDRLRDGKTVDGEKR